MREEVETVYHLSFVAVELMEEMKTGWFRARQASGGVAWVEILQAFFQSLHQSTSLILCEIAPAHFDSLCKDSQRTSQQTPLLAKVVT